MNKSIKVRGKITDEDIKELVETEVANVLYPQTPFIAGKNYLIRTITMIDVGRVKSVTGNFVVLTDASWIGDTGRFNECLKQVDVFNEIEPFKHDVFLNLNAIVDATPWPYALPTAPK